MNKVGYEMSMRLRANWGDKASAMDCNVEFRINDSLSGHSWYIYAQDPENPWRLLSIEDGGSSETLDPAVIADYSVIKDLFELNGDYLIFDNEFVPRLASVVYQKLKEKYDNKS